MSKGTVLDKEHFNDVDDLELKKVTPEINRYSSEDREDVRYFINNFPSFREEVEALDPETILSTDVITDSLTLKNFRLPFAEKVINVTLKN